MIFSLAFLLAAAGVDNLAAAKSALEAGLPAVAIHKLEDPGHAARDLDSELVLAKAYLADGKPEKAAELLKAHPVSGGDFWLAQAYAAMGCREEALEKYRAARREASLSGEALIGEARMLRNLGKSAEALSVLKPAKDWADGPLRNLALLDTAEAFLELRQPAETKLALESVMAADPRERARRDYLMAQSLSMAGNDSEALRVYEAVIPVDPAMAAGVATGKARSLVAVGQAPAAENLLEDFLTKNPDLPGLEEVFLLLDSIYSAQTAASPSDLKRWADDEEPTLRKKLATFYLARFEARLGREDRMGKLLESAVADPDPHPFSPAFLELAAARLKQARPREAVQLLPPKGISPFADYVRGLALAAMNDAAQASEYFLSAASDEKLGESALYNAAVCDLLHGTAKSKAFELLKERYPESPKLNALLLQKGYEQARRNEGSAPEVFEGLSRSTDSRVAAAAALAGAEWKYENNDRAGALSQLRRVSTTTSGLDARSDALSVFLADDGGSDDAAIATAAKYLSAHPGTPEEPEVMMKLGELLSKKGDFAGARVQFESLAKKYPGTALEFPALFLAAQSASRLQTPMAINDSMLLFEEVASSKNPLALRARFEQAVLQNVLGKPNEAIVILDRIAASDGTQEIKAAALIEKGKTLYSLGGSDPKFYSEAVQVWRQLVGDPALSPGWRNQALSRIGSAYEKLGDSEAALSAYYDVIKDVKFAPQAFFWFYKSGFGAARLLESSKRWDQAIKVYELIAAAGGPRSEEATSRINKIRLENFLWDEPAGG